ncbi:hypothetical protein HX744_15985 [Pseudonocardia sp. ICBG1122]|nr:hypothetical protein [Pseudonocardia pini]
MADLVPQRMALEFDTVAGWTRGAVAELGPDHALPAACRDSASPAGLDWLVEACGPGPGTRLADVGGEELESFRRFLDSAVPDDFEERD